MKTSKLPRDKTLATLDFSRLPKTVRDQLTRRCEGDFLTGTTNVCMFGNPGPGT